MNAYSFLRKKYIYIPITVLILAGGFVVLRNNDGAKFETQTVGLNTVTQIVSEIGTIRAVQESDLSLEQSGRITSIPAKRGKVVSAGDVLVQIDSSEQIASVLSARAQLRVEEANLADMLMNSGSSTVRNSNLSTTEKQQEALISNAYSRLLSEGLVAESNSDSSTQTPPLISGKYSGAEGKYKIIIDREGQIDDYVIRTFGLEKTSSVEINEIMPTPLGTKGLYINFPDALRSYFNTVWYVEIPNIHSSVYLSNFYAYLAAQKGADVAVTQAGVTSDAIKAQEARIDQMKASVIVAEINLNKRSLRAPFDGIISYLSASIGETASAGSPIVSIVSKNSHEISVNIAEDDITHVNIGDHAEITFDAYDGVVFQASVAFVSPSAKMVEGVPVFEVILNLEEDERIKSGLSVDVDILSEKRAGVVAVPGRAVVEKDGMRFVSVMLDDNSYRQQPVVVGIRGDDGLVEIKDGLSVGDRIITFINDDALSALKEIK